METFGQCRAEESCRPALGQSIGHDVASLRPGVDRLGEKEGLAVALDHEGVGEKGVSRAVDPQMPPGVRVAPVLSDDADLPDLIGTGKPLDPGLNRTENASAQMAQGDQRRCLDWLRSFEAFKVFGCGCRPTDVEPWVGSVACLSRPAPLPQTVVDQPSQQVQYAAQGGRARLTDASIRSQGTVDQCASLAIWRHQPDLERNEAPSLIDRRQCGMIDRVWIGVDMDHALGALPGQFEASVAAGQDDGEIDVQLTESLDRDRRTAIGRVQRSALQMASVNRVCVQAPTIEARGESDQAAIPRSPRGGCAAGLDQLGARAGAQPGYECL
ncbi:MAG: hypothetical protein R3E87_03170 [Burkholderiaceae bacterium]